jgi:hypothetical protein
MEIKFTSSDFRGQETSDIYSDFILIQNYISDSEVHTWVQIQLDVVILFY